jgi:hypothetical protein
MDVDLMANFAGHSMAHLLSDAHQGVKATNYSILEQLVFKKSTISRWS